MRQASIRAYAKINLVLNVLGKRNDGYHEVEMIMQSIGLYDELVLRPSENFSVSTNHPLVPNDERNLAFKAALLIQKKYSSLPGVEIIINKQIPVEAGLAGGSTDAAAVILGMNQLFSLNMGKEEMLELAKNLGSDVPFCILGPTALAVGRGEIVREIAPCPLFWVVLVKPPFGVKTADVYKNLNFIHVKDQPNINKYLAALKRKDTDFILHNMFNILEQSTFELQPEVFELKQTLKELGANNVLMSGSGPTVFAIFENKNEAMLLAQKIKKRYNQVFITQIVDEEKIKERVQVL